MGVYDVHVSTGKGADGKYGKVTKRVRGSLAQASFIGRDARKKIYCRPCRIAYVLAKESAAAAA